MPTYEYRCPDCAHEFELFQRMSDDPVASCPSCGASAQRLLSAGAGLLFKGDGFYITDYRSADYKKKAEKEGPARKGDSGGGGDSTGKPGKDAKTSSSGSGGSSADSGAGSTKPKGDD